MNNIDVVYTMWENLKKTPAMEVGQVSFHREKDVRKIRVEKKINETVNRLNKTKTETFPGKYDLFSLYCIRYSSMKVISINKVSYMVDQIDRFSSWTREERRWRAWR